jgi:hypothetical protein
MGEVFTFQTERPLQIFTKTAVGVVSNRYFVKQSGAQCTVAGERAQGVSREYADDGKTYAASVEGTALVVAGVVLDAAGIKVTTNASGEAMVARTGDFINGVTMAAQLTVGQLVEIQLSASGIAEGITTTTTV